MSKLEMSSLEQVRSELRASPLHVEPEAGKPVLGYLGDLGHTYARPDQLTKDALFGRTMPEPLIQSAEQKARASAYESQMEMDRKISVSISALSGLASRLKGVFTRNEGTPEKTRTYKP